MTVPDSSTRPTRHFVLWLILAIFSLVAVVLIGEILARAVGFRPSFTTQAFFRYDPVLGWHHIPGAAGRFSVPPLFDINVRINSHGLRSKNYPKKRRPGWKRVLVLGDSFVWGYGVESAQTFTAVLENLLERTEVINAGVVAYSTDQELLWLERDGVEFRPDLVVLLFVGNDIMANVTTRFSNLYYSKPRFVLGPGDELRPEGTPCDPGGFSLRLRRWLSLRSGLVQAFRTRFPRLIGNLRTKLFGEGSTWYEEGRKADAAGTDSLTEEARQLTVALIGRVARVSGEFGARFLLVTLCGGDPECEAVVRPCRQNGLPVVSVDGLKSYDPDRMIIRNDGHWNALGHKFVAERLAEYIKNESPLP